MVIHPTGQRTLSLFLVLAFCAPAAAAEKRVIQVDGAVVEIEGAGAAQVQVQVDVRADAVGGKKKIFVPQPKGAGETLDDSAARNKAGRGDTVTTTSGDKIVGKVLTIEPDGRLKLTAPQFESEIVVKADALDKVELVPKEKSDGPDRIALSNDDVLVGDILGITKDHVVVESKATGPMRISRKIITSLAFAQTSPTVLESNFAKGKFKPWEKRGTWTIVNGAAQHSNHGRETLFAKFEQDAAVTMEARVESLMNRYIHCELVLFADTADGAYGRNSVIARIYSTNINIMYCQNGNTQNIMNRSMGRLFQQSTIRFAYDPETGKCRLWVDSNSIGEFQVPSKLTKGKYVMFNSNYPCRVPRLRVVSGIVGPTNEPTEKKDSKAHVIRFANRDRVAATGVALADNTLSLKTEFGDISSDLKRVASIVFRSEGVEKPRRKKLDVRVETGNSRLTLEFDRLTPEHLVGKSYYLGEVKISRACLRKIQFNLYK